MIRYIPSFILGQYEQRQLIGSFSGFELFFDVADFTPISLEFQKYGKQGAEGLSKLLDIVFCEPIRIVEDWGGFVSIFAGDAFCAIFPNGGALEAAIRIKDFFGDNSNYHCELGDFRLMVRQTISYGEIHWQIYENELQNEYVFFGEPMVQMSELAALKQELIFSSEAVVKIGKDLFQKKGHLGYILTENAESSLIGEKNLIPEKPLGSNIKDCNPQAICTRFISHKFNAVKLHPEIRSAAFCFANLNEVEPDKLEETIGILAKLASDYGGYINKLDSTDKGLVALLLFGIPRSQGNTLERICRFAIDAVAQQKKLALGISYGSVFAGFTGSSEVKEYTALGHPVNLAARLMGKAKAGEIISDDYLYQELKDKFHFDARGSVLLKGVERPIMNFCLRELASNKLMDNVSNFVGRNSELAELRQILDDSLSSKSNMAAYIYGDAGIGKSRLIKELMDYYHNTLSQKFYIYCDPILQKPLEPIKQIMRQYFISDTGLDQQENIALFRKQWEQLAKGDAELVRIESILASFLGYEWEHSIWSVLPPEEKPQQLKASFLRFVAELVSQKPVLIHLDDGQWIDDLSKAYLQALSETEISPIQIISSYRYLEDGSKPELGLGKHQNISMELGILDKRGSEELIKALLKLEIIPKESLIAINSRAMGNPFFIEQLCAYLSENRKIDSLGVISGDIVNTTSFSISDIIGSRIDKLTEELQECVSNASILGMEFNVYVLTRMLNNPLELELEDGKSSRIWRGLDDLRYIFTHILIKDVVYQRMMSDRLKRLHKLAAESMKIVFEDKLDENAEEIAMHFAIADMGEKAADYYEIAGNYYHGNYNLTRALKDHDIALDFRLKLLGEEHLDTAASLSNLANVYYTKGNYLEAEEIMKRAIEIKTKVVGPNHLDTAISLNNLGELYVTQGKFDQALKLHQRALEIREQALGPDDSETMASVNNLANLHSMLGDYEQAFLLNDRALTTRRRVYGEKHTDTLFSMVNYAVVKTRQGDFNTSKDILSRAIEIGNEIYPANSPILASIKNNLAEVCFYLGQYDESEILCHEGQTLYANVFGVEHILTATAIYNIGCIKLMFSQLDIASSCFSQALEIKKKILGENHPDVALIMNSIGELYINQKDYHSAEAIFQKTIGIWESFLGENHPFTMTTLNNLANTYFYQARMDEAESLYERVLAAREKVLGRDHPDSAITLNNLADVYMSQGRHDEAISLYQEAFSTLSNAIGSNHPTSVSVINSLISACVLVGNRDLEVHYRAMLGQEGNAPKSPC